MGRIARPSLKRTVSPSSIYASAAAFSGDGMAAVSIRSEEGGILWGFVNPEGSEAVPLEYDAVQSYEEGMAAVCRDGAWAYVHICEGAYFHPHAIRRGLVRPWDIWPILPTFPGMRPIPGRWLGRWMRALLQEAEERILRPRRFAVGDRLSHSCTGTCRGLKHKSQMVPAEGGDVLLLDGDDVLPVQEYLSAGGLVQGRQDVQQGSLARAGLTHDGDVLAGLHGEIDAGEGLVGGDGGVILHECKITPPFCKVKRWQAAAG